MIFLYREAIPAELFWSPALYSTAYASWGYRAAVFIEWYDFKINISEKKTVGMIVLA